MASGECGEVECLRLATAFALHQGLAYGLDFSAALLLAADQVADQLAVVRESASMYLGADPAVLLVGYGDGFAYGRHDWGLTPRLRAYEYIIQTVTPDPITFFGLDAAV